MPLNNIDFSRAQLLTEGYKHALLENYMYEYDYYNKSLFSEIAQSFQIRKVLKIFNPQLYGLFLLYKEELQMYSSYNETNEVMLYHATSPRNARSIASDNINWRMTLRSRYGNGACFSTCPYYAHTYSSSCGAFVICRVFMKNIEYTGVSYGSRVPRNIFNDTSLSYNNYVYVKYEDYSFYPEYIVYYNY